LARVCFFDPPHFGKNVLIDCSGSQAKASAFIHRAMVPESAMVEAVMYAAIGFFTASLLTLAIVPLLHARAERLTLQRLEATLPMSLSDVQGERDGLRAEFAMATRRLELKIERITEKCAQAMAKFSRAADLANRLQSENNALRAEVVALKSVRQLAGQQPGRRLFKRAYRKDAA
jgi:hypothetical protein